MMKKSFKILILAVVAVLSIAFATAVRTQKQTANAITIEGETLNTVTMESQKDSFVLSEKSYGAQDKFVYTATVSFERGVAAGLVFGGEQGANYWVFNMDREANRVKLLYFTEVDGQTSAVELLTDYFIGNDKMTDSERRLVGGKVASLDKVQLKVVITPESDGVYAEFYADNIRRFGIDKTVDRPSSNALRVKKWKIYPRSQRKISARDKINRAEDC